MRLNKENDHPHEETLNSNLKLFIKMYKNIANKFQIKTNRFKEHLS